MATEVVKTIKPSGGDYSSLSAWEAGEQKNLTVMERAECSNFAGTPFTAGEALNFSVSGAVAILVDTDDSSYIRYAVQSGTPTTLDTITGNLSSASADIDSFAYQDGEIAVAECYSMEDTTATVITGWTTDATRYIEVYTPLSERHDGKWNTSKYRLVVATGAALMLSDSFIRVEGLQLNSGDTITLGNQWLNGNVANFRISHCVVKGNAVMTFDGCVNFGAGAGAGTEIRIWNNVIFDATAAGQKGILMRDDDLTIWIFNNTIIDCVIGIQISNSPTHYIQNNLIDCSNAFAGVFANDDAYNDYNSSSENLDDVALGSNGRFNQVFTYVDEPGDDFHLADGDGGAKDFGTDLSADANLAFSDDIDGDTRSGSWDIGADEVVASVGIAHFRRRIEGY